MKLRAISIIAVLTLISATNISGQSLKKALEKEFLIGCAVNDSHVSRSSKASRLICDHFNSIVAENCMKSEVIHPEEDRYDFASADRFVDFGTANNMFIIGHTLIWHSQLAPWFCNDEDGKPVDAETLKKRMKTHIHTIVGRYKGRIHGWDVVNEAIENDGSWRETPFYQILGEEYIELAFRYAHEADPDAELYYNDFSMAGEAKRNKVVEMIRALKTKGVRIDGIGMQSHVGMDYPDLGEYENSIKAFGTTGVKVMVTEFDLSAIPTIYTGADIVESLPYDENYDPYPDSLSTEAAKQWNDRVRQFFEIYKRNSDIISRVTVWGVTDKDSWKNDFPMRGRTDYPLLFDRRCRPKAIVNDIIAGKI